MSQPWSPPSDGDSGGEEGVEASLHGDASFLDGIVMECHGYRIVYTLYTLYMFVPFIGRDVWWDGGTNSSDLLSFVIDPETTFPNHLGSPAPARELADSPVRVA